MAGLYDMLLGYISLLNRIVENGSMAAAGKELGLSPATVSERIAKLEKYFNSKLIVRSSRGVTLTEEGRILHEHGKKLVQDFADLENQIRDRNEDLTGTVRVSAPNDLGGNWIADQLAIFQELNPNLVVELHLFDGYVDLLKEGIDLAIRFGASSGGDRERSSPVVVRRIVCAAPQYIEQYGEPRTLSDLKEHSCILMRYGSHVKTHWDFLVDGRVTSVEVSGKLRTTDGFLLRKWGVEGKGLIYKSELDVYPDILAGRLVHVLGSFASEPRSLHVVRAAREAVPARVYAMENFLNNALINLSENRLSL